MTQIPRLAMNDGYSIPQLGFGIWKVPVDNAATAVEQALRLGYPLIDGANLYPNEAGLGEGLRGSGAPREDGLLPTKLPP
ncbi:MAG: aldo/keto reductase, partial [Maritimibacter sp.]|nr:aldo/keto reductase [Maritimibacter sp.]